MDFVTKKIIFEFMMLFFLFLRKEIFAKKYLFCLLLLVKIFNR